MSPSRRRRPSRATVLQLILGSLALALVLGLAAALPFLATPAVGGLARESPRTTALLEQRRSEARARGQPFEARLTWLPLERVSPRLAEAVVLSEDASFWVHRGFDWVELRAALAEGWARGRPGRGASTLTQQLAKNLWLGPERTLWRKAREAALAAKLERELPKRRILALYLSAVEWGDGVFGAEAAARHWFGVPANDLDAAQAAVLASMLPAPRRAALAPAPAWLARRARRLVDRMREVGRIGDEEHARAAAEVERILAGAGDGEEEVPGEEEEPTATPTATPTAIPTATPTATSAATATPPGEPTAPSGSPPPDSR